MQGNRRAPPRPLLVLLLLCGLAVLAVRVHAANTNALLKAAGRSTSANASSSASGRNGPSREQEPYVPSAAASLSLSREKSSLAAAAAAGAHAGADGPTIQPPTASDSAKTDAVGPPTPTIDDEATIDKDHHRSSRRRPDGGGSVSGDDGGGGDDGREPRPSKANQVGGAAGAIDADADADANTYASPDADGSAVHEGSAGLIPLALRPVSLAERAKERVAKTWSSVEVGLERALHVRREVKAVFSSELERCLLKATRPENIAVDETCMQTLLAQANRLSAVEACCDCDPHEVVCSKVLKKMMEQDWRTVAKALYVVHRLQRDSPPKEANRFSAFIRDQWAEGAGGLGKHMRVDGGMFAPWLKVYCGYLAARGLHLETATNAFRSWETLTSTRQLRNALAETNALLAAALALHFADDASSGGGGGEAVRRECCALAFRDVADVRAMLCGTGQPPALLGVLGVGDESGDEKHPRSQQQFQKEAAGVAASAEAVAHDDGEREARNETVEVDVPGGVAHSKGEHEEDGEEAAAAAAAAALQDISEDVLKAAKECAVYEDVSGVITAVYSARYGNEVVGSAVPVWMRQMAALARLAARTSAPDSSSSRSGSDGAQLDNNLSPTVAGEGEGEGGAREAAGAAGAAGAAVAEARVDGGRARAEEGGAEGERNSRFGDNDDGLRGGGSRRTWSNSVGGLAEGKRGRSMADIAGTTRDSLKLRGGGGTSGDGWALQAPATTTRWSRRRWFAGRRAA
eukprot:g10054.t1